MRFFGPLSSLFDLATFAFLYFILCPALLGDNFTELSSAMQSQFAILFHTGWFLESMWTQVLILHLLRTKQLSILRSRASGVVWLVTSAGLLILTAIVYTPAAHLLGPGSPSALVFWISGGHHSGLYAAGNGRQTVVYSEIPYIVVGEGT